MRPIDADVLLDTIRRDSKKAIDEGDKVGSFWLGYAAGSVIAQPTIQPQSTAGQLNDSAQSTNLIDRQETIDRFNVIRPVDPKKDEYTKGIDVGIAMCIVAVKDQPTIQPVATDTNVGDIISRLAAIEALQKCRKHCIDPFDSYHIDIQDAENQLSKLPTIQPVATDKVRFGDKDHVWIDGKQYISLLRFQEKVKEVQPKEGHWIEGGIYRDIIECYCSECGQLMTTAATVRMNYCPNCGAKMRGEQHETD